MKAEAIVLVGPPGVGKGTQGLRIAREGRIPYLNMSDIMRAKFREDPELAQFARELMAKRKLLPDAVTNRLWAEAIRAVPGYNDLVIDGYPRTSDQFEFMRETLLALDIAPVIIIFMARYEVTNDRRLGRIEEMRVQGLEPRIDDLDEEVHMEGFRTYQRELLGIESCIRTRGTFHHYVNAERSAEKVYQEVVSHFHLPHINTNNRRDELVTA